MSRIVETDNYGRDYPDEEFLLFPMPKEHAQKIADAINAVAPAAHRYWKVVEDDYQLQPGFEP